MPDDFEEEIGTERRYYSHDELCLILPEHRRPAVLPNGLNLFFTFLLGCSAAYSIYSVFLQVNTIRIVSAVFFSVAFLGLVVQRRNNSRAGRYIRTRALHSADNNEVVADIVASLLADGGDISHAEAKAILHMERTGTADISDSLVRSASRQIAQRT